MEGSSKLVHLNEPQVWAQAVNMNREVPRQKDPQLGGLALKGFNIPLPLIIILNQTKANAIFFAFQ